MTDHTAETAEYHVVAAARSGKHPGSRIYLAGPGPRRLAIAAGEAAVRRDMGLAKNVAVVVRCVFSGSEAEGLAFMDRLSNAMDDALTGASEGADYKEKTL